MVGYLDDWPLRCQVLTVPGQFAYAERRFRLLSEIDAVVFVCESTRNGLRAARVARVFLSETLRSTGNASIPIVFQANKQDLPDALSLVEVRAELSLDGPDQIFGASAKSQEGVRDTFLGALVKGRERVREVIRHSRAEALPHPERSARGLYEAMLAEEAVESEDRAQGALSAALAAFDEGV